MYVDDKFIHWLQRNSTQTIARPLSFRGTFHIWTIFYTFWVTSSQKIANELDHTVEEEEEEVLTEGEEDIGEEEE